MKTLTIGLLQAPPGDREKVERLASRVRDASLVILPEYSGGLPGRQERGWTGFLERLSEKLGVAILAGIVEEEGGCRYSSVALFEPGRGYRIVARKAILFDALGVRESEVLCRGSLADRLLDINGLRVGVLICYELRFPEVARMLALQGALLIAAPSAWYQGPLKEEHLYCNARCRALENTVYLAVADLPGPRFAGRSMLVDPMGVVRLQLGAEPGYVEGEVDPGYVKEVRGRLPVLRDASRLLGSKLPPEHGEPG